MTKTCPGCGFVSTEARYCRMCGTPLPGEWHEYAGGAGEVSPQAATIPLSEAVRRETGDIARHDTQQPISAPTARVGGAAGDFWHGVEETPAGAPGNAADANGGAAARGGGDDRPLTIAVRPVGASRVGPPDARDPEDATPYDEDESTRISIRAPTRPRETPSAALALDGASRPLDAEATAGATAGAGEARPAHNSNAPARRAPENRALGIWAGLAIFGVVLVVLVAAAVGVGWYFLRSVRDTAEQQQPGAAVAPTAAAPDALALSAAKLAEAEGLIAAGRKDEAVALLREAAALDPANAEPHRRLARLLLESGARRTAVEELREVVRIDASDAKAWRELADAQLAENLHRDAADSYRRLNELDEGARADDRVQLSYADALRLSGRESDAKSIYGRLASSRVAEVARASRQRLAQFARDEEAEDNANTQAEAAAPGPTASPARRDETAAGQEPRPEAGRVEEVFTGRAPTPAPDARLSPNERYARGVRSWGANRPAAIADFAAAAQAGNADANYYLGLNLAEGRDARALKRGELMGALTYFQRARRGRHGSDARRYEEQLLREYDRRQAAGER